MAANKVVAIIGAKPPPRMEPNWYAIETPVYRILLGNACVKIGGMAAKAKVVEACAATVAIPANRRFPVSNSGKNMIAVRDINTAPIPARILGLVRSITVARYGIMISWITQHKTPIHSRWFRS